MSGMASCNNYEMNGTFLMHGTHRFLIFSVPLAPAMILMSNVPACSHPFCTALGQE